MIKWRATDKWGCNYDFFVDKAKYIESPLDFACETVEGNFISNSMTDGSISIKLPCKSFKDADNLVEMVCQANNLKIMSAYIS
jgi:hypothetical protein